MSSDWLRLENVRLMPYNFQNHDEHIAWSLTFSGFLSVCQSTKTDVHYYSFHLTSVKMYPSNFQTHDCNVHWPFPGFTPGPSECVSVTQAQSAEIERLKVCADITLLPWQMSNVIRLPLVWTKPCLTPVTTLNTLTLVSLCLCGLGSAQILLVSQMSTFKQLLLSRGQLCTKWHVAMHCANCANCAMHCANNLVLKNQSDLEWEDII